MTRQRRGGPEPRLGRIEAKARDLGRIVKAKLPSGVGFCLVLFEFGDDGWLTYISSAERESMIATLQDLLDRLRGAGR